MKYYRKKPSFEKTTRLAKTIAVFGIVVKEEDGFILIIQDNPKKNEVRRWKNSESFFKFPGGKVLSGETYEKAVSRKIREETKVSSIHISKKREPILEIKKGFHSKFFYLMKYIQRRPSPGKNIKLAKFLSPIEIKEMMEKGKFLEDHKLALEKYFETLAS